MEKIKLNINVVMKTKVSKSNIIGSNVGVGNEETRVVTVSISPESIADMATAIAEAVSSAVKDQVK